MQFASSSQFLNKARADDKQEKDGKILNISENKKK